MHGMMLLAMTVLCGRDTWNYGRLWDRCLLITFGLWQVIAFKNADQTTSESYRNTQWTA